MLRLSLVLVGFVAAVWAMPADMPEPSQLALVLGEEEFEDYLDAWLTVEQLKLVNASSRMDSTFRSGCTINVNGDLGHPQPVYLRQDKYLNPTGSSGQIHLNAGEQIVIACPGSGRTIRHPNLSSSVNTATATCVSGSTVSGAGWLSNEGAFRDLACSSNSYHEAEATGSRCYNNNIVIRVGFVVSGTFYPLYWSCFDENRLEVLYVWYEQTPANSIHQTGVDRPSWLAGNFFSGASNTFVNNLYTQVQQKAAIAGIVGDALADKYVTNTQFLARGHLAAKSDFIFATGQRASFWFINSAPQWQPFNGGNWNTLEQRLKTRIAAAGYNTMVYTGTFGVTQLRDQNDRLVDIYLHKDVNNNPQLPVPLYYYKVVYDASLRIGTAFVGVNNPYYTETELKNLTFCTDRCRNNSAFNWLGWQPDRIDMGYSFCCDIDEFRKTIPHLPGFTVDGLLA